MNVRHSMLITALALGTATAFAQTAAPAAPASPWTLTGNAGLYSDYTFRGISQTNRQPAFQGGFDIAHSSGLYAGNWNSNVDSGFYNGANLEMDFYGGYKATFGDFGLDVGAIYYYYPGTGAGGSIKINNGELYIGGSWGPLTAKYSYAVTDFFSAPGPDSSGSSYLDLGFTYDVGSGFGVDRPCRLPDPQGWGDQRQQPDRRFDAGLDHRLQDRRHVHDRRFRARCRLRRDEPRLQLRHGCN